MVITIIAHHVGGIGGMEHQLERLVDGLLVRGHEVAVVARRCRLAPHPRLTVHRVPGPFRPFIVGYLWFAVLGGVVAARHRRGVVHTTGALVPNHADLSTVHFVHSAFPLSQSLHRGRSGAVAWLNAFASAAVSRSGERFVYRRRRTYRLVAVSAGAAADLSRIAPHSLIDVIPNGVDRHRFRPDPAVRSETRRGLNMDDDALVAVFVGGDWSRKGLSVAIEALERAPEWHLVVVGPGDPTTYHHLCARAGVTDRVRFIGSDRRPERFMQAADAFVYPSSYEALPLVLLEAAACALPILVTRVNGVAEIVEDGVSGRLVDRTPEDVAAALNWLRDVGTLGRQEIGAAGRRLTVRLTWDSVVDRYEALYATISTGR